MGSSRTNMPTVTGSATSGDASNTRVEPKRRSLHLTAEGWDNFLAALMYYFGTESRTIHWIIDPDQGFCLSPDPITKALPLVSGSANAVSEAAGLAWKWLKNLDPREQHHYEQSYPIAGYGLSSLTGFQMNTRWRRDRTDQDILEIKPAWV